MTAFVLYGLWAIACALFLRELMIVLLARVPTQTRALVVGENAPLCQQEIPRVLWTYWPDGPSPFIHACLDNWRRCAPDHEVRLLDRASLPPWLPTLRADFDTLSVQRQTDWLRVQLLTRHGGIWMDAATLLSRDLAWLHETRKRRAADYVGFYLDRDTTRPTLPLIEASLMASVPGGPFVTALASAFDHALDEGAQAWLQRLQAEGRLERVVQRTEAPQRLELPLQLAASELLDREHQFARLVLLRAEDGPLAWQARVGWRPRRLHARLSLVPCPRVLPAVLALRDGERAIVERNWRRGLLSPFSALVQMMDRAR
jgi:hypothetical protein